ncbi:MAG: hypothetical protein BWY87_01183 [Deltaproteobacteria bacterium ADurb.Bin510]|nr:MAG: hypothetical protein BWY87_01183 [Deltaproteobacteria bacterium ADurb.Bin510]
MQLAADGDLVATGPAAIAIDVGQQGAGRDGLAIGRILGATGQAGHIRKSTPQKTEGLQHIVGVGQLLRAIDLQGVGRRAGGRVGHDRGTHPGGRQFTGNAGEAVGRQVDVDATAADGHTTSSRRAQTKETADGLGRARELARTRAAGYAVGQTGIAVNQAQLTEDIFSRGIGDIDAASAGLVGGNGQAVLATGRRKD